LKARKEHLKSKISDFKLGRGMEESDAGATKERGRDECQGLWGEMFCD
jgi:hypothetical protein